jgi:hypothetical protein
MSLKFPKPGVNHVGSYQLSGVPFVTSSAPAELGDTPVSIEFPFVTRWLEIKNTGGIKDPDGKSGYLKFGFSQNGVKGPLADTDFSALGSNANFFVVEPSGSTGRLELRCKQIFLARSGTTNVGFSLIAGLTGIEEFPVLTASFDVSASSNLNGFEGIG